MSAVARVPSRDALTAQLWAVEKAAMTDCESASMKAASLDPQQAADWADQKAENLAEVMDASRDGQTAGLWAVEKAIESAKK